MRSSSTAHLRSSSFTGNGSGSRNRSILRNASLVASVPRRRSIASSGVTMDPTTVPSESNPSPPPTERTSLLKKAFSKAYRDYKKKQNEAQLKSSSKSEDGSAAVKEILLMRDLSRRKRNSFCRGGEGPIYCLGYSATNVTAYLAARVEAEKPSVEDVYQHGEPLVAGFSKTHMHDVCLIGYDKVSVSTSKFILGCYSCVLEDIFFKDRECKTYNKKLNTLVIDCCNGEVIKAALHHCFSGELPPKFDVTSPDESVARKLAQLDRFAYKFQMKELRQLVYRTGRKLINKRPVLACAVFDELSFRGLGVVDSLKRYALDTMREMPCETLLGGGVQWMGEEAAEVIMQDQDLDVDEFYMFKILRAWESGAKMNADERRSVARRLSKHVDLRFIDEDLLVSQVKSSGYFDPKEIAEAVRLVKESTENRNPHEMERVLVEGAGSDIVNGIYLRVEDEMGMSEEEILFVKEADDGYSDVGLYLYGSKWHIAMCADYSNCFYFCKDNTDRPKSELVPRTGWAPMFSGVEPVPICSYIPNTRASRQDGYGAVILAPNLEEMLDPTITEKRRSTYLSIHRDDTTEKRRMTLEEMMNLPEDRGSSFPLLNP
mmetsp:Transcript_12509/g.26637  ORF Transcript_12509/g.26637 Transcript_12509/m.26637 type:complete len:602 (+) Transcript_12509:210-2015(+)